jgi:type IX secretion system PorP/SprF family membrane protein
MFKIRHIVIVILMGTSLSAAAQQEVQLTHFMFNQLSFNPAYAGVRDAICTNVLARQQWVGFTDGEDKVFPQTNLFTIDAPVNKLFGKNLNSGIGLTFMTDKLGFEENMQVRINYAYMLNVGPGRLSLGASAGFLNKTIDFSKFVPIDPSDPLLNSVGIETDMLTDFAFGAYFNVPEKFYVGLSASQLSEADFEAAAIVEAPFNLQRHFYLTGGYYHALQGYNWVINPNLLMKSDLGSTQFDINVLGIYNSQIWGGLSYRANDAVALMVGAFPFNTPNLAGLRMGYSYDVTTSKLGRGGRSGGSHEIYASYCFKIVIKKYPTSYSNIRYLPTL